MMNPDPQTGGLFSFLNRMRRPNQTTGLSPLQNFGQALDPLILPSMRAGEAIRAQGQQRLNEQNKNRSLQELQKMAAGGDQLAQQLLVAVQSGEIGRAHV